MPLGLKACPIISIQQVFWKVDPHLSGKFLIHMDLFVLFESLVQSGLAGWSWGSPEGGCLGGNTPSDRTPKEENEHEKLENGNILCLAWNYEQQMTHEGFALLENGQNSGSEVDCRGSWVAGQLSSNYQLVGQ